MALFGRRNNPVTPPAAASQGGGQPPAGTQSVDLPWKGHHNAGACNLGYADIVNNFPNRFAQPDKGVHAETLLCALGGVAGFAAQCTLRALIAKGTRKAEGLQLVTTKDGREFLYGDPLNDLLTKADPSIHSFGLWPLAAGAAVQGGVPAEALPDLSLQFAAVSKRLGDSQEGFPEVEDQHRPAAAAGDLIKAIWPFTLTVLNQAYPDRPGPLGPVPQELWATVAFMACNTILGKTMGVLNPVIGFQILMQSAIYGSKISPKALQ